ncbi:hypothetical protein B5D77_13750 [Microcystis sp. MC19]|nr:hypothetical protein B5D77_13750 [Microcystis sp. MC19]
MGFLGFIVGFPYVNPTYFSFLGCIVGFPYVNPTYGSFLGSIVGFRASTQPCILREVVDRPNLGRKRPLRSKGHHHNLPDKTRTVAGVVAKTINF